MDLKKKHWFKSYPYNRKQNVKLNINNIQDCFSTWESGKQEIPRGSVLGPLDFITCI